MVEQVPYDALTGWLPVVCLLLGSVSVVEKDLHSLRVQILKFHMRDTIRFQVAVKDLK